MLLDDLERLRGSKELLHLLEHYAQQNALKPDAWLDRLMRVEGAEAQDLVRWHGELIACGWIEQNTGYTPSECKPGAVLACYRVTSTGRRALRVAGTGERDEESDTPSLPVDGQHERTTARGRVVVKKSA